MKAIQNFVFFIFSGLWKINNFFSFPDDEKKEDKISFSVEEKLIKRLVNTTCQKQCLSNPDNREIHCKCLKLSQKKRLQDSKKQAVHREHLSLAQQRRLMDPEN